MLTYHASQKETLINHKWWRKLALAARGGSRVEIGTAKVLFRSKATNNRPKSQLNNNNL